MVLKLIRSKPVLNDRGELLYFSPWGGCQFISLCYVLYHWSEYSMSTLRDDSTFGIYAPALIASFISLPLMSILGYLIQANPKLRKKYLESDFVDVPGKRAIIELCVVLPAICGLTQGIIMLAVFWMDNFESS
ncbi:MAG: hypothetical protein R3C11_00590 [Planctomycetaceae bacterium]